jgi:hypothetical protein
MCWSFFGAPGQACSDPHHAKIVPADLIDKLCGGVEAVKAAELDLEL